MHETGKSRIIVFCLALIVVIGGEEAEAEMKKGVLNRIFYAETMKGGTMHDVIVQEFNNGKLAQILTAKSAKWQKEKNRKKQELPSKKRKHLFLT